MLSFDCRGPTLYCTKLIGDARYSRTDKKVFCTGGRSLLDAELLLTLKAVVELNINIAQSFGRQKENPLRVG